MHIPALTLLAALWFAAAMGAADGPPDLSGTYDTSTLTPLQRPERFGDRLELSEEEAEAIAR